MRERKDERERVREKERVRDRGGQPEGGVVGRLYISKS